MVRLEVLAGTTAAARFSGSRFPIRVGRAPGNDLTLDEPGVWPNHFSICREKNALVVSVGPDALLRLNGEQIERAAPLRNGDILSLGSIKIRFGFTPVRQSSLVWRERLTWVALASLACGEIAVAYILW